ncbi:MAG TPA: hypothetical protein PKW30_05730, partial [Campylobacterales bacterium]|nr:hypothetical protein [Campylobacterales bacterium]
IQADDPRRVSEFESMGLLEIITKLGIEEAKNSLPKSLRESQEAVAEAIENNVRAKIIKEHLNDPTFFENMSVLLDEIIKERKANAIKYEEYLKKIAAIAKQVQEGKTSNTPESLNTGAKVALYHYFGGDEQKAIDIYECVIKNASAGWLGDSGKENLIKKAIYDILADFDETQKVFEVIKAQSELIK